MLASGSDPHPHRSLGCVEGAMADRRKRRQPLGSMSTARQQQCKRPRCPEILTMIVKAAVAIAILLSVVATTAAVIQGSAAKTRQRIHEPRRLVWEEHRVDLARRGMLRRMYRMEEQTLNLLAELLRPILSHNDYYPKGVLYCTD